MVVSERAAMLPNAPPSMTSRLACRAGALVAVLALSTGCAVTEPPRSSVPQLRLLAHAGGPFVAVDPDHFRIAVHDGEGRLIAEHSPQGFHFAAARREHRLGSVVDSSRSPQRL